MVNAGEKKLWIPTEYPGLFWYIVEWGSDTGGWLKAAYIHKPSGTTEEFSDIPGGEIVKKRLVEKFNLKKINE